MKILIDIPKYIYNTIIACDGYIGDCDNEKVGNAIKNGILLPKGHGKLKDVDHYIKMQWEHPDYSLTDDEPTIIEADDTERSGERNDTDKRFDKENGRFFHWRRILRKR